VAFDLQSLLAGSGGAFLGFIGGMVQQRTTREARFETRVDTELKALRAEVEACREERPILRIVSMGLCMIAPELRRLDSGNPTLKAVADAFAALPPDSENFGALLAKVQGRDEPGHEQDPLSHP
jgi:hypothetical protein